MKYKRIGHILVCFVLICSLLVGISPIKAKASVAVAAASFVAIPAVEFAASTLVTLGVMVGVDQLIFDGAVNDLVHYMSPNSRTIRVLQTIRDGGEKVFYATADLLESVRCWLFDSGTVEIHAETYSAGSTVTLSNGDTLRVHEACYRVPFVGISGSTITLYEWVFSELNADLNYYLNGAETTSQGVRIGTNNHEYFRVYKTSKTVSSVGNYPSIGKLYQDYTGTLDKRVATLMVAGSLGISVSEGLKVGSVPTTPITGGSRSDALSGWANDQLWVTTQDATGQAEKTEVYFPIPSGSYDDIKSMTQADALASAGVGVLSNPGFNVEEEKKVAVVDLPMVGTFQGVVIGELADSNTNVGDNTGSDTVTGDPSGILGFLKSILDAILSIPEMIVNGIKTILIEIFVPSSDFLSSKVDAICAKFSFADSIASTIQLFSSTLRDLGSIPPVIYIDLGSAEGSYHFGGEVVFMDLSWYSRYKPVGDAIISAFLWLVFVWRIFIKLPGIIAGLPGDWVMGFSERIGISDHLPSRSLDYATKRATLRDRVFRNRRSGK